MPNFPIEKFRHAATPFYYYDLDLLRATLDAVKKAAHHPVFKVHYAVKANPNPRILETIARAGLGADCVSGGEIRRALKAGFPAEKILFAGVGKTDDEIRLALRKGIGMFNVESEAELDVIIDIARDMNKKAPVAIRVNPNIDAHTHHFITTGTEDNKFGIDYELLAPVIDKCVASEYVDLLGLHFHIGSQITITRPFELLCERINELVYEFERNGICFRSINVGGGLGIDYDNPDSHPIPDFENYFKVFARNLHSHDNQDIHFELGRAIVGQCGSLITRVLFVKKGIKKRFAIVDAGFTDLIRPAFYQAFHPIQNLTSDRQEERYDVVGPICESSDCFGENVILPGVRRGDIIAIRSAGAYGEAMASQYNCRNLPGVMFG